MSIFYDATMIGIDLPSYSNDSNQFNLAHSIYVANKVVLTC